MQSLRTLALVFLFVAVLATPAASHSLNYVEQQLLDKEDYFQSADGAAPDFALQDAEGRIVRMTDLRGKVVVLNFIYTTCVDFCPLHTELIARLQSMINQTPMKATVEFVTVTTDPTRDTGQVLIDYGVARGLDPVNWMLLTAGPDQPEDTTRILAKAYGIEFTQIEDGEQMHGVVTSVIDQDGRLRARFHSLRFEPISLVTFVNALTNRDLPDDGHGAPGFFDWLKGFF